MADAAECKILWEKAGKKQSARNRYRNSHHLPCRISNSDETRKHMSNSEFDVQRGSVKSVGEPIGGVAAAVALIRLFLTTS